MSEKEVICSDREMYLTPDLEEDLQGRLSRIEGHVRGIKKMLAQHKDCESLLTQVAAVKAAINQVSIRLIEGHMETCVKEDIIKGKGVEALGKLKGALSILMKNS